MRVLQWILSGLTLAGLLYIIALNSHEGQFYWLPADKADPIQLPAYIIILVTFIAGYVIGLLYYWLGAVGDHLKSASEIRSLKKQIKDLEAELTEEEENIL